MTAAPPSFCPNCGATRSPDALFCEECAFDFTGGRATTELAARGSSPVIEPRVRSVQAATPVTAEQGDESPLDVGWTGAIARDTGAPPLPSDGGQACTDCRQGTYVDGYCDNCGSKQRDPRDHFVEEPQPWLAGVCDIGIRHSRNEDAMALHAQEQALSFGVIVVCDGVSNSTDSHIASLAASRAAREVLDDPVPRGMGTRTAIVAAIEQRLGEAVEAACRAVVETTADREVESPPSCTFVAALVDHGVAVVATVGDSRAYWLPDAPGSAPRQLTPDDSYAAEQMAAGVPRAEAETGVGAHAITRWLGSDAPEDITPHTSDLDLDEDGWLLVASDGLWNYCSEATDLRALVHDTVAQLGTAGRHPATLAQALTDFALGRGGMDNITVALVRVGQVDAAPQPPAPEAGPPTGLTASTREPAATPGSSYRGEPPAPSPSTSAPTEHPVEPVDPVLDSDDGKDTP